MWEAIKDYLSTLLGAFLLFISMFFITEIKTSTRNIIILTILVGCLTVLGIDKLNRDNHEKTENTRLARAAADTIGILNQKIERILEGRRKDSISFGEFTDTLKSEFHIIRDSLTNKPKIITTYNTHINRAETVNIGR